jgi:hypothetical protein
MARAAAEKPSRPPHKVGLLRVFKATAAVARYCARNAVRLLSLIWFPSVMAALSVLALDYLTLAYPPRLPDWLLVGPFNPPTWLTAVVQTPWGAMMWTFVLADMGDRNTRRGLIRFRVVRPLRARFELSPAILVAAVVFSAVNLLDGGLRLLNVQLLATIYRVFESSDELLAALVRTGQVVQVIVMAAAVAAAYLVSGQLLRVGFKGMAGVGRLTRHNRLRVFALFLLLSIAAIALDAATAPAVGWVLRSFADELFWTFKGAFIRQLLDLPFFMLWTVVYAVTAGVVLGALEQRAAAQAPAQGRPTAASAPPARSGGSRSW